MTSTPSIEQEALALLRECLQIAYAAHRGEDEWRRLDAIALTARMLSRAQAQGEQAASSSERNGENNFCRTCGCCFPPDTEQQACRAWEECRKAQAPQSATPRSLLETLKDFVRVYQPENSQLVEQIDAALASTTNSGAVDGSAKREGQ